MARNSFEIEICEDGSIKVDSEDFDEKKHMQADEFSEELIGALGGKVLREEPKRAYKTMSVTKVKGKTKVKVGGIR